MVPGSVSLGAGGSVLSFVPSAELAASTLYSARITVGVKDVAGNPLAAEKLWSFTTAAGTSDTTPPFVIVTNPVNGATAVAANATVEATFSEAVSVATVTTTTFTLTSGGSPITGIVTLDGSGTLATFQPAAPLTGGAVHTASITTGVLDLAGNAMLAPRTWSFTTATNGAPVADAGAEQDVAYGAAVTLDGQGSHDPEGTALTYAWTQTAGPDVTGGSHQLVGARPQFTAPAEFATLTFELEVSDGVNTSGADPVQVWVLEGGSGVFVSTLGSDASAGTRAQPLRTVQAGIEAATIRAPGVSVYIAAGTYSETVVLAGRASLYGGFDPAQWLRNPAVYVTTIAGGTTAVDGTVTAVSDVRLDGLAIESADAPNSSSYGVRLESATNVTLFDCRITAGRGAAGQDGGFQSANSGGISGSDGGSADCANPLAGPGGGGPGGSGRGLAGGSGGVGDNLTQAPGSGETGSGPGGGPGGARGSVLHPNGFDGSDGIAGADGAHGAGGLELGTVSGTDGLYLGSNGRRGTNAQPGNGGGGGGGSYRALSGPGHGGGGGGSGGEPGKSVSNVAGGGGGSFGVLLCACVNTRIDHCVITSSAGGPGGAGGTGGAGGAGAPGGSGGSGCTLGGGNGGAGGAGGQGGAGGGGGGGPSICIGEANITSGTVVTACTLTPGTGGPGGGSAGNPGAAGISSERKQF